MKARHGDGTRPWQPGGRQPRAPVATVTAVAVQGGALQVACQGERGEAHPVTLSLLGAHQEGRD